MAAAFLFRPAILACGLAVAACGPGEPNTSETAAAAPDTPVSEPAVPVETPILALPVGSEDPSDCKVPEAAMFAGRRADAAVRAELAAAVAPITMVRWVEPGEPTTEDYRAQRLNVMLDVGGTIVSAHCG